jgi:glycosyltransferase involved in cell wall biosynthesis
MTLQVLVATMNQHDYSLLNKMNIQSDAIVGNQCDRNEVEEFNYNEYSIKYLSFNERGVGLNRNNALMRATADICILADDDMVFVDNYAGIVEQAFDENPTADVIIFNLIESAPKRYVNKQKFRVRYRNYMRFGAARIAFRTRSVTRSGISFNLHFGGGAEYSAGEDTLFLHSCLNKKLKIIAVPYYIASLTEERESSWFKGYTQKYFIDKGIFYACLSSKWARLLCLQDAIRHRKVYSKEKKWIGHYKTMCMGVKVFGKNR